MVLVRIQVAQFFLHIAYFHHTVAQEGSALFMTTNYQERLDKALIRAGRVDCEVVFDYINAAGAQSMFKRLFDKGM